MALSGGVSGTREREGRLPTSQSLVFETQVCRNLCTTSDDRTRSLSFPFWTTLPLGGGRVACSARAGTLHALWNEYVSLLK